MFSFSTRDHIWIHGFLAQNRDQEAIVKLRLIVSGVPDIWLCDI